MTHDERLSRLAWFRGYGDYENSRFLYIGIEEGLAYETVNQLEKVLRDYSKIDEPWPIPIQAPAKPINITERMQARLSIALLKKYGEHPDEKVAHYDLSNRVEFCANIYPFGAESQDKQPKIYNELFKMEKGEAQHRIDSQRKRIITEMIRDFVGPKDGLVFIFGKRARAFIDLNLILEELEINISDDQIKFDGKGTRHFPISYSTNLKIWLTGHPSHSWFNEDAIAKIVARCPASAQ